MMRPLVLHAALLASVVVTGARAATVLSTPPALDARFAPRAYVSGPTRVPVQAWPDRVVVRAPGRSGAEVEAMARTALEPKHVAAGVRPESVTELRPGLFEVKLLHRAPRAALVSYAEALAARPDVAGVYPALHRMGGLAYASDELVVSAARGALERVLATVLEHTGGTLLRKSAVQDTALVRVGAAVAFDAVEASARLQGLAGLRSAEPNLFRALEKRVVLDDPLLPEQWHLARLDDSVPGTGTIHADIAWDTTLGDSGVVVAVFDSGIDVDHPDLAGNMLDGFDAASDDDDPRPECTTDAGGSPSDACPTNRPYVEAHGTAVSGIIGASGNNGTGVSGVCPGCTILPVRLLGDGTSAGLSTAEAFVRAVDLGADVINNSWGPGSSLFFPLSQAERDAFDYARTVGRDGKGTVILFAAGNETSNVAGDPYGAHPYILAIAASTNLDDWALYSNYGEAIDVAAPSQGLPADQDGFPDDDYGIVTTDVEGDGGYSGGDYETEFSGTSAASPVAAGVVGLVLSVNDALTAEQVRLVLTRTADKIVADKVPWPDIIGEDIETVFAYDENGHSIGFGYGRVNAAAAVSLAADPGIAGGPCDAPGCTLCSSEDRCLLPCATQADCADGSICDVEAGACALPVTIPGAFGEPCTADCAFCAPTFDTDFAATAICTAECTDDLSCPEGFDCRLTDVDGPSICVPGSATAGEGNDFFNCYAPLVGGAVFARTEGGRELCVDICASNEPGACPYGFSCVTADCDCATPDCFELLCEDDDTPGNDATDFPLPVCMPKAGHADVCVVDVDCQNGDYCGPDGACRLDDRAGCDVCNTCTAQEDCLGRGRCFGLRDDGVGECLWLCEDVDPCPGDSVCRPIDFFGGDQVLACVSPEGGSGGDDRCDPAYQCTVTCRDDIPCGEGLVCDDGACVPAPEEPEPTPDPNEVVELTVGGGGCQGCAQAGPLAPLAFALLALGRRRRR